MLAELKFLSPLLADWRLAELISVPPTSVGNTGWGRNNKVLRKSHGNQENPVPEVARTPLTYVGQALPGPSTPSLFIYSLPITPNISYINRGLEPGLTRFEM
jgi:hypothetical protein